MSNIKRFIFYSMFVTACILSGTFFCLENSIFYSFSVVQVIRGIAFSIALLLMYWCVDCWIHNMIYFSYFKRRKYTFSSVNIFPIMWIRDNRRKVRFCFRVDTLMSIFTQVSFQEINQKELCEQYIQGYKKVIHKIKNVELLVNVLYLLICFLSIPLGIMLLSANGALICLNSIKSTGMIKSGLWNYGCKEGQEYGLFLLAATQPTDKKNLYYYVQQKCALDLSEMGAKEFMIHLIIDSIYEKTDYICLDNKEQLKKMFLTCNSKELCKYSIDYLRLIRLYYIYLSEYDSHFETQMLVQNNWNVIKTKYKDSSVGEFCIQEISKKERFDVLDMYEYYIEKDKVYEKYI